MAVIEVSDGGGESWRLWWCCRSLVMVTVLVKVSDCDGEGLWWCWW